MSKIKRACEWYCAFRDRHPAWMLYELSLIFSAMMWFVMGPVFVVMQSIRSGFSMTWALAEMWKMSQTGVMIYFFAVAFGIFMMVYDYFILGHKSESQS